MDEYPSASQEEHRVGWNKILFRLKPFVKMDIVVEPFVDLEPDFDKPSAEMQILLVEMHPDSFGLQVSLCDHFGGNVSNEEVLLGYWFLQVEV